MITRNYSSINSLVEKTWLSSTVVLQDKGGIMDTVVKSIRFTKEEERAINEYADFANRSFSDVVKSAILYKLEDEYDIKISQEAYEEYLKNPLSHPIEELFEEFDV